jgi:hypothetical protein
VSDALALLVVVASCRAHRVARREHDDVVGRCPQPRHEPGHVVDVDLGPAPLDAVEELEPQLQARRIGPLRIGRSLQRSQIRQIGLDRFQRIRNVEVGGPSPLTSTPPTVLTLCGDRQ